MSSKTTLYKLLKETKVSIPIIQRDYAQGRKGKAFIRKAFLSEIKNHLENAESITLDFVYGNNEHGCFSPLDGQQRLTTLWLIHWYLSWRTKNLVYDKEWLQNFSYETRISSSEFCKALCTESLTVNKLDIADHIKAQTWFYSAWLQDPTISSMLRTISGEFDDTIGKKDDCIEGVFSEITDNKLLEFWDGLINKDLVSFEQMIIGSEKLPISDDLYIKMNARGKELTDLENFKADLISWIQSDENPEHDKFNNKISKIENNKYIQYYPIQIDNAWTDVFWHFTQKSLGEKFDGKIDEVFFSFINRYVLNKICLSDKKTPADFAPSKDDETCNKNSDFNKLFGLEAAGTSADDSLIAYSDFKYYKDYLKFSNLEELDKIFTALKEKEYQLLDCINSVLIINDNDADGVFEDTNIKQNGYTYIPQYETEDGGKRGKLRATSQKERVYFHAICLFITKTVSFPLFAEEERSFKKWMRVVKNLTENAAIDNIPSMVTCLRTINNLGEELIKPGSDIYGLLAKLKTNSDESQLERQLKEEIEKAKKINEDECFDNNIIEAEQYMFFNGSIRFLFRDENGNTTWNDFDNKFKAAKELFKNSNKQNLVETSTIKSFLKLFDNFDQIKDKYLFTNVGYHARHKCWKRDILCSDDNNMIAKVHQLLIGKEARPQDADNHQYNEYDDFLNSGLIEYIVGKSENYRYRYHGYHGSLLIHKDNSSREGVYLGTHRKSKCEKIKDQVKKGSITLVDTNHNQFCEGYYWGTHVDFEYNGKKYGWYVETETQDFIRLLDENGKPQEGVEWNPELEFSNLLKEIDKNTNLD